MMSPSFSITILSLFLTMLWYPAYGNPLLPREVSPDNSCGGASGYTCPSNMPCCSKYGWCGSSDQHCGDGCQPSYGTCTTATPPSQLPSTGGVADIPRPAIGNVPYGQVITSCVNDGDIAITFDDGPSTYTPDLLDILASYGVKATFFVLGDNGNGAIDKVPEWTSHIQRTDSDGHQIASHTYSHPDLTTLTSAARYEEMYQTEEALLNILGKIPTYMRPPYLAFNDDCAADMAALGYHVISRNLDTKDYANDSPNLIANSKAMFNDAVTEASPSSSSFTVLNHDLYYQTVHTLVEYEIERALALGYNLVTVGECLGDPADNWYRTSNA